MSQFNQPRNHQQHPTHARKHLHGHLQKSNQKEEYRFIQLPEFSAHSHPTQDGNFLKQMNTANEELLNFTDKLNQWKIIYNREIGNTKAALANLTPRLLGLGLAAKIHKLSNVTSSRLSTPNSSSPYMTSRCGTPYYITPSGPTPMTRSWRATPCITPSCGTPIPTDD